MPDPTGADPAQTDQAETVAFLSRLAGRAPIETHISLVFPGPDTVWKLKKAVRLPFLDFTRVEDRRHFCAHELALNAPAAPGLYRDVVPLTRRVDGSLELAGEGAVIDWVLRMAPVPAGDFLDARAAKGPLSPALLDAIADAVAAYHGNLTPIPDLVPDMAAIAEGNVRSAKSAGLPDGAIDAWQRAIRVGLSALAPWSAARAAAGFVRRCHGDLHLGNLCLWRGGPTLFDALEFDETLARIDVAYDLAFLLMDLEHRQDRAAANRVLNRYVGRMGDAGSLAGLPVFLSVRAMIRAHVERRSGHDGPAATYLDAALAYLKPRAPVVVAIGGLPGTGKSTLARALAPALGAAPGALIARSDEIRKRQHGVTPEQRLPAKAYTPEASARVFAELADQAQTAAKAGHAVIADATFLGLEHRDMIQQAAITAGADFLGLWLTAPRAELEHRIAGRENDASDATVAVLRAAAVHDPGARDWHEVDATDAAAALALVKTMLQSHIVF